MFPTSTLSNNLRLLTIPVASVPSVSVLVLVKVGSRYENEKTNGLAHFVEHMVFQGNDKWKSKFDLSVAVDQVGAEYNGLTAKEYTGYFVKAEAKHLELALDVLSQMLWHSHFLESQIAREKPVIIEEINYREDSPQVAASDLIMEMVFKGNPLGLSGAGEKEAVQKFQRPDFLKFHKEHYHSNNTIVVVAGEFKQKEVEEKINQYFSMVESGKQIVPVAFRHAELVSASPQILKQVQDDTGERIRVKEKTTEQTHFCLGLPAFKRTAKERYSQAMLNIILGSGVSSRLFQKIREEKSLAYYIDSDIDPYLDTGIFAVAAGVNPKKLEEAVSTVTSELDQTTKSGSISVKELRKAKDYLRGRLVLQLEESLNQAMFFGLEWLLEDEIRPVEEILKEVEKVTLEEVTEVAKQLFQPKKYKLAIVGNKVNKAKLEQLMTT